MAYVLGKTWTTGETADASEFQSLEDGVYDTHYANAGAHNSIYRGKNLGTTVTASQIGYISAGTFYDLFVGDYWTIDSAKYIIGEFDYWAKCGSTSLTTRHALVVPEVGMYSAPMNATDTTEGAYAGSAMFTCEEITVSGTTYTGLADAISTLEAAFGSYLLSYSGYYANAATDGYPSAQAWYTDRECDLMTEQMVYGSAVMQQLPYGGTELSNRRIGKSQISLFALNPRLINIRTNYWLQDIASKANFTLSGTSGIATAVKASNVYSVRPYCLIGA